MSAVVGSCRGTWPIVCPSILIEDFFFCRSEFASHLGWQVMLKVINPLG